MNNTPNNDFFVSAIIPVKDSAPVLEEYITRLTKTMERNWRNWEIILVAGGLDSKTESLIHDMLKKQRHLRYLRLSRPTGRQASINVGLENAIGDCVVAVSPWNDPPEMLPEAIRLAQEKKAAVFGRSLKNQRKGPVSQLGSAIIHRYCRNRLGTDLPNDHTGFFCLNRRELNALLKIRDQRHPILISLYTGYPHVSIDYNPMNRRIEMPHFSEKLKLAYDIMIAGHFHPLRLVSVIALVLSLLNLAYLVYVLIVFMFLPDVAAGWSSLSVQNSVMFFFLFLVLSVLCEYVGRMVRHGLDWPRVFIAEERNSSVFGEDDRVNVIKE